MLAKFLLSFLAEERSSPGPVTQSHGHGHGHGHGSHGHSHSTGYPHTPVDGVSQGIARKSSRENMRSKSPERKRVSKSTTPKKLLNNPVPKSTPIPVPAKSTHTPGSTKKISKASMPERTPPDLLSPSPDKSELTTSTATEVTSEEQELSLALSASPRESLARSFEETSEQPAVVTPIAELSTESKPEITTPVDHVTSQASKDHTVQEPSAEVKDEEKEITEDSDMTRSVAPKESVEESIPTPEVEEISELKSEPGPSAEGTHAPKEESQEEKEEKQQKQDEVQEKPPTKEIMHKPKEEGEVAETPIAAPEPELEPLPEIPERRTEVLDKKSRSKVCPHDRHCAEVDASHFQELEHPKRTKHQIKLSAYKGYLKIKLDFGLVSSEDRKELQSFRRANKITDAEHAELLAQMDWNAEGIRSNIVTIRFPF